MISVELTNFGPHKHLKFDTDVSVVGLMGNNGSGKSNFLKAIQFAFTGKATGPQDEVLSSYIYDGGASGKPATSAKVALKFRHQGAEGRISRTITRSSTTRELVWDGKTLTKQSDVDSALTDVLGVDKYMLENAVFIPQGTLDKLLFGLPTEREESFIKMMLLGYMANVSDAADQRISMLSKTVQDMTVLKDEIRSRQASAEADYAELEAQLKRHPEVHKELEQWNILVYSSDRINELETERHELEDTSKRYSTSFLSLLAACSPPEKSWDTFLASQAFLTSLIASETESVNRLQRIKEIRDTIQKHESDLAILTASLQECSARGGEFKPDRTLSQTLSKELEEVRSILSSVSRLHALNETLEESKNKKDGASAFIARTETILEDLKSKLSVKRNRERDLRTKCEMLVTLLKATSGAIQTCPLCDHAFHMEMSMAQNMLRDLEPKLEACVQDCKDLSAELTKQENGIRIAYSDVSMALSTIDKCQEERTAILESRPEVIAFLGNTEVLTRKESELMTELTKAEMEYDAAYQAHLDYVALKSKIEAHETALSSIVNEDREAAKSFSETTLASKLDILSNLRIKEQRMQAQKDVLLSTKAKMEETDGVLKRTNYTLELLHKRLSTMDLLPVNVNIYARLSTEYPEDDKKTLRKKVLDELELKKGERNRLLGQVQQAKQQADEAVERLREIENREAQNRQTLTIIDDLKIVREAFSRKGIPRAYIAHYYQKLIQIAQECLESMEANFTTRAHPDKPVTLEFVRNDNDSGAVFNQNKMSGGQKVKLSVAFLLAIQKLLVPKLGFLCLDEPSTHGDTGSKEALRDLIASLGAKMSNSETQIWVCDHDDVLATAFGTVIRMGG